MKFLAATMIFVLVALLPRTALTASSDKTLDEILSRSELAREFHVPDVEVRQPAGQPPLTPAQVLQKYGVNVFTEFPIVIVVNTAETGTTAQHLILYHNGVEVGDFKTSTGREIVETPPKGAPYFSDTPVGWFAPTLFEKDHISTIWDASMEFSIFFNGGIAIHATNPEHYAELGTRASGGCVRLTREDAVAVWNLAFNQPSVRAPVFNAHGDLKLNSKHQVLRHRTSGVLVLVVNNKD